jgi:hypothetical protein
VRSPTILDVWQGIAAVSAKRRLSQKALALFAKHLQAVCVGRHGLALHLHRANPSKAIAKDLEERFHRLRPFANLDAPTTIIHKKKRTGNIPGQELLPPSNASYSAAADWENAKQ